MSHPEVPEEDEPERLTRAEMVLIGRSARQNWGIPEPIQQQLVQVLINMSDPEHDVGKWTKPRDKARAIQTLGLLQRLRLEQQRIDGDANLQAAKLEIERQKLALEQQKIDLLRMRYRKDEDDDPATHPAGGLPPSRAALVLRVINEPSPDTTAAPEGPQHAADDA